MKVTLYRYRKVPNGTFLRKDGRAFVEVNNVVELDEEEIEASHVSYDEGYFVINGPDYTRGGYINEIDAIYIEDDEEESSSGGGIGGFLDLLWLTLLRWDGLDAALWCNVDSWKGIKAFDGYVDEKDVFYCRVCNSPGARKVNGQVLKAWLQGFSQRECILDDLLEKVGS